MIKVVIFDFDDTLVDFYALESKAEKALVNNFKDLTDLERFYKEYKKIRDKYQKKTLDPKGYSRKRWVKEIVEKLGLKIDQNLIDKAVSDYWNTALRIQKVYPDAKPVLEKLKGRYKLVLVTDSDGEGGKIKSKRIKKSGLAKYFDLIVDSAHIGVNKPGRAVYDFILNSLKVKPKECLFVGDSCRTDIKGANLVGMVSVRIKRGKWKEYKPKTKEERPDYTINNLEEVFDILKSQ